jgi:hypothetical protein
VSAIDRSFWGHQTIAPIPTLAQLRDEVLLRSQKRSPKWKFRLVPDLVVQIQPKPCMLLTDDMKARGGVQCVVSFDGRAYFGTDLTRDTFEDAPHIYFTIFSLADTPDVWQFRPTRTSVQHRDPVTRDPIALDPCALLAQLRAHLTPDTFAFLRPEMMLSPNCLLCGKGLTDPASMARFVGPECAGTSSLTVPSLLPLDGAA